MHLFIQISVVIHCRRHWDTIDLLSTIAVNKRIHTSGIGIYSADGGGGGGGGSTPECPKDRMYRGPWRSKTRQTQGVVQ